MIKPVTATIALGASLVGAGALALYFLLKEVCVHFKFLLFVVIHLISSTRTMRNAKPLNVSQA